jgi:hypothetical protein
MEQQTLSKLWVALASDTEDNHPNYVPGWHSCGSNLDLNPSVSNWGWSRYWRDLSECFTSQDCPVTWLIRVDNGPIKDGMLELFKNEIIELRSNGDEVGIHIHTWAWDQELSKWVQTKDAKQEIEIVLRSLDMFRKKLGFTPSSVRMGWNAMSNEIMTTLDACGLLVDASAIPGTFSLGKFGNRDNIYDWSRTPNEPYHPSYEDYQSPGNMNILEVPISTYGSNKSRGLTGHIINRLSATRSRSSLTRLLPIVRRLDINPNFGFYISPWWSLSANSKIIKAYCKKAHRDGEAFLVGFFHACDIIDPRTGKKNLLFEKYLSKTIKEILSLSGIDVTFTKLAEIAKNYDTDKSTRYSLSRKD